MVGVDLPEKAAGFLMEKELKAFATVLENPQRPLLAILGGAKIADKIPLIQNLLDKADEIIIGGGMAFTFKKVLEGMEIGDSLFDPEGAKIVGELIDKAKAKGVKIHLPVDFVCARQVRPECAEPDGGRQGRAFRQAGRASMPVRRAESSSRRRSRARRRSSGTDLRACSNSRSLPTAPRPWPMRSPRRPARGAVTVVGGGDTATAAKKFKVADKVTHCFHRRRREPRIPRRQGAAGRGQLERQVVFDAVCQMALLVRSPAINLVGGFQRGSQQQRKVANAQIT